MAHYVLAKDAQVFLGITSATLLNWRRSGKIQWKQLSPKKFLYDIDSVDINVQQDKLNVIIEQNNEILNLLKNLSNK